MQIGPITLIDSALCLGPCTLEEFAEHVPTVFWMQRNCSWWAGDALAFGEARFGDDTWACVPEGHSQKHLMRLMGQSRKVPISQREAGLSWTHHSYIQRVQDPILRRSILRRGAQENLSSEEFRELVQRTLS